jgi:Putative serine esterase (DUF676)
MKRNEAMKSRPQIGRLFAGALLLAAAIFPLQSFAEVRPAATILVHGLDTGWPARTTGNLAVGAFDKYFSTDCNTYWADWKQALPVSTGTPVATVALYSNTINCTGYLSKMTRADFGQSNEFAHFGDSIYGFKHMDNEVNIEHLGYRLAWWIYRNYSASGKTVNIVGHSMGGLVARYAVGMTARRHADFPPFLYVNTLATVSSPHNGTPISLCGPPLRFQCRQMLPNSAFLNVLNNQADFGNSGIPNRLFINASGDPAASERTNLVGTSVKYGKPYNFPYTNGIDTHGALLRDTSTTSNFTFNWFVTTRNSAGQLSTSSGANNGAADGPFKLVTNYLRR